MYIEDEKVSVSAWKEGRYDLGIFRWESFVGLEVY